MNKFNFKGLCIIALLILSFSPSQSIETGKFPDFLNEMEVSIPVEIHIWSSRPQTENYLQNYLPTNILQETLYPSSNKTDIWQVNINSIFFGLTNKIQYNFNQYSDNEVKNISEKLLSNDLVSVDFQELGNYQGIEISSDQLELLLQEFNINKSYNIHLMDLSYFKDDNQSHWINHGLTDSIKLSNQDMRNIIQIGSRGIVVDPTAISPYFGHLTEIQSNEDFYEKSALFISKIIENYFLGSPQSYNLLPLEDTVQIDRIVITNNTLDPVYTFAARSIVYQAFENQVETIFPYFTISQKEINSDINDVPQLIKLINDNTFTINNQTTIIVDFNFAESFKNIIRQNYHNKYPSNYYYGIFLFTDPNWKFMMNVTENNTPTNSLIEYNVGNPGFAIDSLSDWYDENLDFNKFWLSLSRSLNVLGKNFGLATLDNNYSAQIESPMSTYGVSSNWDFEFSRVEIDQINRRHFLCYTHNIILNLNEITQNRYYDYYFWLDKSMVDEIEAIIQDAITTSISLNYTGAIKIIKEAQNILDGYSEDFNRSSNFIYYSYFLVMIVFLLAYYSKILFQETISKDEFIRRIKNRRENN